MNLHRFWPVLLSGFLITCSGFAQNIFLQKVGNCVTTEFCIDCGNPKAGYDSVVFTSIVEHINHDYHLTGSGRVLFQVLIDSLGNGCVLSHTDVSQSQLTKNLIGYLNACKWTPAIDDGKPVRSSVNVMFILANGKISGQIQRVDQKAFTLGMKSDGPPKVYNTTYKYTNPNLEHYEFKTWNKDNSKMKSNLSQHCLVDQNDILWYSTMGGTLKFDGKNLNELDSLHNIEETVDMGRDYSNNLWFSGKELYRYHNGDWMHYDSAKTGFKWATSITSNPSGEVLFATDNGLVIFKNDKWDIINKQKLKELPGNRVYFAYRDQRKRLWIGTFDGSIMIDGDGKVTTFNASATPLTNVCIIDATEDENGNIYFSILALNQKGDDRDGEGLAVLTADGKWQYYNDKNSGLPANYINNLFYDKFEKVLWISSHTAGLVRFDLNQGWENYHNRNSGVPSCDIYQVAQDSKGTLYLSTYNGLLQMTRKR